MITRGVRGPSADSAWRSRWDRCSMSRVDVDKDWGSAQVVDDLRRRGEGVGRQNTRSPGPTSSASRLRWRAAVHEFRATACVAPNSLPELLLESPAPLPRGEPPRTEHVHDRLDLAFANVRQRKRQEAVGRPHDAVVPVGPSIAVINLSNSASQWCRSRKELRARSPIRRVSSGCSANHVIAAATSCGSSKSTVSPMSSSSTICPDLRRVGRSEDGHAGRHVLEESVGQTAPAQLAPVGDDPHVAPREEGRHLVVAHGRPERHPVVDAELGDPRLHDRQVRAGTGSDELEDDGLDG